MSSIATQVRSFLSMTLRRAQYFIVQRSALRVCATFVSTALDVPLASPRAFVYVSAEDVFRPWIPAPYIESKREAELGIERILQDNTAVRGVFVRPSMSTPPFPFSIPSSFRPLHSRIPLSLR